MEKIKFVDCLGRFEMKHPEMYHNLYFPVASEQGIKSVVTPNLNGDSKLDQNTFLLEPVSIENLHNNRSGRNFWCVFEDSDMAPWSAVGNSTEAEAQVYAKEKDDCKITAGYMWQTVTRSSKRCNMTAEVTSFVPYDKNVEIMQVVLTNSGDKPVSFTGMAAVPMYGRSADNIRDHRHVTSLLHRIRTTEHGVLVKPTLSFDERGHQKNQMTYYVCGISGMGQAPVAFYPSVDQFLGEAGTYTNPEAVFASEIAQAMKAGATVDGQEAVGAFAYEKVTLAAGQTVSYTILLGATDKEEEIASVIAAFDSKEKVDEARKATEEYWQKKVNVGFTTGNSDFDNYMRWVCFQPFLRRVYGCSFLPHHDYGKGGRGWRDLWQDCLALLIMDPKDVHGMIVDNFGGVRVDGTNATIIGSKQGQFIADRNNITRVWMDHGMWPFLTTKLYIEQTGDLAVLTETANYFKDPQVKRGTAKDTSWTPEIGNIQLTADGKTYEGTILEHLLFQHVGAMLETGEHGNILLRGADWNDAIDMANHRGESVAFTCAYAGNLIDLAKYVRKLQTLTGKENCELLKEFVELMEADDLNQAYQAYQDAVMATVSGDKKEVSYDWLATWLEEQGQRMMDHIRANEWISDSKGHSWFNSYYDDHGNRVEGETETGVRMMLTGQVFSIMSGVASEEQVASIASAADAYLYEKEVGGYKLNTDFKEEKYDMGRMFGFAYGEKENGAVFSHMTVMYANALYQRGFVREGYKALQTLADTALNFETSQIFPGVPEYFNAKGKGLYHYLTGAASWYELTMVNEVFGVKGTMGDLGLTPKLVKEQFDTEGKASISLVFADKDVTVTYVNAEKLDAKEYNAISAKLNGKEVWNAASSDSVVIPRTELEASTGSCEIVVELARR